MSETVECARRVVVSVTPRLLCDSLVTLLVDHGVDAAASGGSTARGTIAVVGRDDDVPPDADDVVRLLTEVGGTPAAIVHASPDGPSVRVEGIAAIIRTIVDLANGAHEGRIRQGQ